MAKGICVLAPGSRVAFAAVSGKNELVVPPGDKIEVGDGRTSVNLEGASFRSLFHIPVPHENADGAPGRAKMDEVECDPHEPPLLASADGVLG